MRQATTIRVAVASPHDVVERTTVSTVFQRWNASNRLHSRLLDGIFWETDSTPGLGAHPQKMLNPIIVHDADLLVAMFWSKLGTRTDSSRSGTVEEIEEFIKIKGPGRVMVYFCTRSYPANVDPQELIRLNAFRDEMKGYGIYQQFNTSEEFASMLYPHLDRKVDAFLNGQLPEPKVPSTQQPVSRHAADPRLREPIDLGSDLKTISQRFTKRMENFAAITGASNDKYHGLAAHVYTCAADAIDRVLYKPDSKFRWQDRSNLQEISSRLKTLVEKSNDYLKPFGAFWLEGEKIASELATQVAHLERLNS